MPEPLDWDALVREAKRRRKAEGLTQQAHAALAGVSRETMRAFDNGERSLTLEKALAILGVVGLAADGTGGQTGEEKRHAAFVRDAWERWQGLVADRPADDPARLPHGRVAFGYRLSGLSAPVDAEQAQLALSEVQGLFDALGRVGAISGWTPFHVFNRPSLAPVIYADAIECWLAADPESKLFYDAPHLDFWRASIHGDFFLLRGYQEDGADSEEHGTFMDLGLPVWRTADVVEHAARMARLFPGSAGQIAFTIEWHGLKGRRLVNWRRPTAAMVGLGDHRASVDMVRAGATAAAGPVDTVVDTLVPRLLAPFYAAFALSNADALITDELERRRQKRPAAP